MASEEILGGLKAALARGESLKQAMMSFYNAGYKKENIEAAARALYEQEYGQPKITQPVKQVQQQTQPIQQVKPKPQKVPQPKPVRTIQRVSNYEQAKPKRKLLLFLMIFLLLALLGILAGIYFFKQELIDFFSNLF